jgi:hypothetical protein
MEFIKHDRRQKDRRPARDFRVEALGDGRGSLIQHGDDGVRIETEHRA